MAENTEHDESFETIDSDEENEEEMFDAECELEAIGGATADQSQGQSSCSHYKCGCSMIAPCCKKQYFCRLCHNEAEDHEVDRFEVTEVVCRKCETHQPPAERCLKCDAQFGHYVCVKCRLFDFSEKGQWHCDGCGICRVGGKDNFFHCDKCGYCLAITLKDGHRCVRDASKNCCAICLTNLHDSRIPLVLPKCGHPVHQTCYKQMIRSGVHTCPTCKESVVEMNWKDLDDMLAEALVQNPIPEDMVKEVGIICNDCHEKATVKDYLLGLYKCPHCGSYNTQR